MYIVKIIDAKVVISVVKARRNKKKVVHMFRESKLSERLCPSFFQIRKITYTCITNQNIITTHYMLKKDHVLIIWDLLLILAPIYYTYAITEAYSNADIYRAFLDYLHYLVYGFLYSIPGFLAIYFIYLRLRKKIKNLYLLKAILLIVTVPIRVKPTTQAFQ